LRKLGLKIVSRRFKVHRENNSTNIAGKRRKTAKPLRQDCSLTLDRSCMEVSYLNPSSIKSSFDTVVLRIFPSLSSFFLRPIPLLSRPDVNILLPSTELV
jgi:hypothetical protein